MREVVLGGAAGEAVVITWKRAGLAPEVDEKKGEQTNENDQRLLRRLRKRVQTSHKGDQVCMTCQGKSGWSFEITREGKKTTKTHLEPNFQ